MNSTPPIPKGGEQGPIRPRDFDAGSVDVRNSMFAVSDVTPPMHRDEPEPVGRVNEPRLAAQAGDMMSLRFEMEMGAIRESASKLTTRVERIEEFLAPEMEQSRPVPLSPPRSPEPTVEAEAPAMPRTERGAPQALAAEHPLSVPVPQSPAPSPPHQDRPVGDSPRTRLSEIMGRNLAEEVQEIEFRRPIEKEDLRDRSEPGAAGLLAFSFRVSLTETGIEVASGFRSTDTSDWEEVSETTYSFVSGGVVWMKRRYPADDDDGEWTSGYGTPPSQDSACAVVRIARTVEDGGGVRSVVQEHLGNIFVIDIARCD